MSAVASLPQLPDAAARWELRGAGLETLSLASRRVEPPGPGEVLLRVDACGICFSDVKIVNLGGSHPRLVGRDLSAAPVVMGHETAMTVVAADPELADRFPAGSRWIVQADVYFHGENLAFGYKLAGGYSQYQTVGREVLDGDEGCYLLPIPPHVGYAQAALCEPWACVEAAYAHPPRRGPKPEGALLSVRGDDDPAAAAAAARTMHPGGLDDVLIEGRPSEGLATQLLSLLRPGAAFAVRSDDPRPCEVAVDAGAVHYRGLWLTGACGEPPVYPWDRRCELAAGGDALFIGAGGPLGQMHLQRALSLPRPPRRIVATQRAGPRLAELQTRFARRATERGVEWLLLDVTALGDATYDRALAATGGRGFDDIVTIIPDVDAIATAYRLLAPGGGLNLFAGVAVGSPVRLDLARVYRDGVRLWGTSGSRIADLQRIVARVSRGELATDAIVAAVGGIEAVAEGLAAVRDARFPGKTVIYPHLRDLPLTPVPELAARHAGIAARLTDGRLWNRDAEAELLRVYRS